jgi:hypothetical protein
MHDEDVRRLFDLLDGAPAPEFVATLRRHLLDLVDAPEADTPVHRDNQPDPEETITMVELNTPERSSRRRLLQVSGAVAAAIVLVVALIVVSGGSDQPATSVTTAASTPATPTTSPEAVTTTEPAPSSTITTTSVPATTIPATTPDTAPSGPRTTLPADVSAGTYELASAVVPLEFTTVQPWSRVLDFEDRIVLGRGLEASDGEFLIVFDRFRDATPGTILDQLCVDQAVVGTPNPTTMMGVEGFRAEGTTSAQCPASKIGGSGFFIGADRTFVITAAEVDGHVVVTFASAPSAAADAFVPEIDALVASMQMLN